MGAAGLVAIGAPDIRPVRVTRHAQRSVKVLQHNFPACNWNSLMSGQISTTPIEVTQTNSMHTAALSRDLAAR
jgi:hypothetical protein